MRVLHGVCACVQRVACCVWMFANGASICQCTVCERPSWCDKRPVDRTYIKRLGDPSRSEAGCSSIHFAEPGGTRLAAILIRSDIARTSTHTIERCLIGRCTYTDHIAASLDRGTTLMLYYAARMASFSCWSEPASQR